MISSVDLAALEQTIDAWFAAEAASNSIIDAVERDDSGLTRWFVRVRGEQKDVFTIWFTLGQRTLRYETYVMPAPEENHQAFYEHLLKRNLALHGAAFAVGDEDAVFLAGHLHNEAIDDVQLDRLLGSMYEWVEQFFVPALRIGFASRLAANES